MRLFIFVLIALNLSACATTANYERNLNSWVGSSEGDIVSHWGPPHSSYEMTDGKVLTYLVNNGTYVSGQRGLADSYVVNATSFTCKTMIYLNSSGVITNWRYEGNACAAQ